MRFPDSPQNESAVSERYLARSSGHLSLFVRASESAVVRCFYRDGPRPGRSSLSSLRFATLVNVCYTRGVCGLNKNSQRL